MNEFNIYITGVGGQGIGLLSQALLRAIDHAGIRAIAVDTHGLAQRGGVVISCIRCGTRVHSPLIMENNADLVLGMEIHESLRGLERAARKGGTLVYLDVCWQPLPVRLGQAESITKKDVKTACKFMGVKEICVPIDTLEDSRMQNMALLGSLAKYNLVPGVDDTHYHNALSDLLDGDLLEKNLALFKLYTTKSASNN